MMLRRLSPAAAVLALAIAPGLRAQVQASLVSADASVQPGKPLTVALRLDEQPHWHTYWVDPGTGTPTTLKWTLPPGWKAGEIRWPVPVLLRDDTGTVIGNGYQGVVFLPVTLTPPAHLAPGGTVRLQALAEWLMCRNICKPGRAVVGLTLPVAAGPSRPDPRWGARIRAVLAGLPRADANWRLSAVRGPGNVVLRVTRVADEGGIAPSALHFFSDDDLTAYDGPQAVAGDGRGGFVLTLPISMDAPADATRLTGVLSSATGWAPGGTHPGLKVDVPFGPPPAAGAADASSRPLRGLLGLAFLGGLILNLMPCVFPVLAVKILGFVNQAGRDRRKVAAHGFAFSAGVLLSFWALAGILALLRAGGAQLGWGFQLQSPGFVFGLAALMLVFGLNLSGVFEFGLSATAVGSGLQSRSGIAGSFLTGALATVVATPCSAPFLAPALGAALALSAADSFLIFTAIAVGLAAPYLVLSLFPGAVRILPRPGAWMATFRQFLAFPLYATVGYLVWILAGQVSDSHQLTLLLSLVCLAFGVWLYGRGQAPGRPLRSRLELALGLVLAAFGLWAGWPRPAAPTDITWEKWSPETVAQLRADGRIIYVDFTARWCATCQANKKLVFHSADVLRTFRDRDIATLRADWTNQDPAITAALAKYHRSAVPFDLFWIPNRPDPVILPTILTPGVVLGALRSAGVQTPAS
jgi:DsbC/DsbD-like thiol-disulfide interchange protein/cytochrome c biogenesis protein CcdA